MGVTLFFLSILVLNGLAAGAGGTGPRVEPVSCKKLADELEVPASIKPGDPPAWRRVDAVLTRLVPALQGQQCAFRFADLFKDLGDSDGLPLTNRLLAVAEPSSLQGLAVYDGVGVEMGRIETFERQDADASGPDFQSFFGLGYRTPQGQMASTGRQLLEGDLVVNWADVRDKVAVDAAAAVRLSVR